VEPERGPSGRGFVPQQQRVVGPGIAAVGVAPHERARAVVLRDQRVAVVQEPGDPGGAAVDLVEPPERIVAQGRAGPAARTADQAVLDVVDERVRAVRGQSSREGGDLVHCHRNSGSLSGSLKGRERCP
jgi:hypothetical protein